MRLMYFGENKQEGTGRVAVIRFTDDEFDLYKYIEKYEHTHGEPTRRFACGGLIGVERNKKGVWINESYISVDDFTDFNDFKVNYKEAKKEFKSLKKQLSDEDPNIGEFVYDVVIHNFYGCDTYTVRADGWESAKDKALKIMKFESLPDDYASIDSVRIYEEYSDELIKEIIFESAETEPKTSTDPETADTETETTETTETETADEHNPQEISTFTILTDRCVYMNQYFTEIFLNDECIGESDIFVSFDDNGDIENAYCKSLMIYPEYRNKGYGTEFLRRVSCYYNWFHYHKFDSTVNRVFIVKCTFTKKTTEGNEIVRCYSAEITLNNIALESGLIHLMTELKNHGFEVIESDFFGWKSFIDCYVESGDRSMLFIENNESGVYIQYRCEYES